MKITTYWRGFIFGASLGAVAICLEIYQYTQVQRAKAEVAGAKAEVAGVNAQIKNSDAQIKDCMRILNECDKLNAQFADYARFCNNYFASRGIIMEDIYHGPTREGLQSVPDKR